MPSAPSTWSMSCTWPGWRWSGPCQSVRASDAVPELPYGSMPVPATPIGELRRWRLDIQCSRCRRHVMLRLEDLLVGHDRSVRIGEIVRRLRCDGYRGEGRCMAKPSRVTLAEVYRHGKSAHIARQIDVTPSLRGPIR